MSSKSTKSTRVLGIIGSPRKKGNTNALVGSILEGAKSAGAKTESVFLRSLKIKPCIACDKCQREGVCRYDDDMAMVFDLMKKADVWVFGTPVYWWGPTAQMKAFIDRWYAYQKQLEKLLQGRLVILAIPFGDDLISVADHTVGVFYESMKYLGKEIDEIILAPGVNDLGEIHEHPDFLKAGFNAGVKAAG